MKRNLLLLLAVFTLVFTTSVAMAAIYPTQSIVFSSISSSSVTSNPLPTKANASSVVSGIGINGYSLINIYDLASKLGATVSIDSTGNKWTLVRNGMSTTFTKDSTSFTSTVTYTIQDLATTPVTNVSYTKTFTGNCRTSSIVYNNIKYVDLRRASEQLGALIVGYDSTASQALVFDWRVNVNTPLQDDNTYVVGGPWITNWSTYSSTKFAPHFNLSEIWDKSSSSQNPDYFSALKMSVKQIQCAENVRKYYSNNSLTLQSTYRTWKYNYLVKGDESSLHMRGRAWDAPLDSLYAAVKAELSGSSSTPIDGGGMWISRVYPYGYAGKNSGGYRIEKMPTDNQVWLHLDTPRTGTLN